MSICSILFDHVLVVQSTSSFNVCFYFLQIRLDKLNRTEWSKVSKVKTSCVSSDQNGYWSDFDLEENVIDQIEYAGVPPDQNHIEEFQVELDSDSDDDLNGQFPW